MNRQGRNVSNMPLIPVQDRFARPQGRYLLHAGRIAMYCSHPCSQQHFDGGDALPRHMRRSAVLSTRLLTAANVKASKRHSTMTHSRPNHAQGTLSVHMLRVRVRVHVRCAVPSALASPPNLPATPLYKFQSASN